MTLRHLKIFLTVCDLGGVTRAAEALHISQPAISHTIAELEHYYNISLFDRINQRLVLTEVGKEILGKARAIVEGFDEFEEFALLGGNSPRVRIGCSLTLGQTVVPRLLNTIGEKYPELEPTVAIKNSAQIELDIENGNLDFALIEDGVSSPYLIFEPFQKDRILLVANTDMDIPSTVTLARLVKHPLILREHGSASRDSLEKMTANSKLSIEPFVESANNQAIVSCVYASLGVALLPESFARGHIERGKFKEIKLSGYDGNRESYIVRHKNKKLSNSALLSYEVLKSLA